MGRTARYTPEEMRRKWREYKEICDNQTVRRSVFSHGKVITADVPASITYTIEGFCRFLGLRKSSFYSTYCSLSANLWPEFEELISIIRAEVELDARAKFEMGVIPAHLAGLWMGRYGYTNKTQTKFHGASVRIVDSDKNTDDSI